MKYCIYLLFFFVFLILPSNVLADGEETLEVQVIRVISEENSVQELEALVIKGSLTGQVVLLQNNIAQTVQTQKFIPNDKLLVYYTSDSNGNDLFYISESVRRESLFELWILFCIVVIAITGIWGITSILGMAYSFFVIFAFILPQILAGHNPIFIAILGATAIIPVTFYLSHGISIKTTSAVIGTIIALIITGVLAAYFIHDTKLTGFASEEAGFLQDAGQGIINIKGLLLAGIIIGALGALDDVTVSQSSIVFEIASTLKKKNAKNLYMRAMKVGKDHISSAVNTLILVYTGAALPLLLLFINNPHPFSEVVNYEIIAEEIVRTLVGSIGLILAVPITTAIACLWVTKNQNKNEQINP